MTMPNDAPGSTPEPAQQEPQAPQTPEAPVPGGLEDAPHATAEDVFRFDPFAEGRSDGQGQERQEGQGQAPEVLAQPTGARGQQEPTQVSPTPLAPTPTQPDLHQLVKTLAENQQALMTLLGQGARAAAQQQQAPPQPRPEDQLPQYEFSMPPEMIALFNSENPEDRVRALLQMATGVAQSVHRRTREEFGGRLNERLQASEMQFNTRMQQIQTAQRIYNDFYGTYPQLQRSEIIPVVQQVTNSVTAEMGNNWSPQVRDEIARRVFAVLTSVQVPGAEQGSGAQQPPRLAVVPPTAQPTVPPRPPAMRGTGARVPVAAPPPAGSQQQHIDDVLFAGFEVS